jgi:glycosyltransferase involved in cell wall biosynthesis
VATTRQRILVVSQGIPHSTRGASTVLYYAYLAALKASGNDILHLCLNDKAQGAEWDEYLDEIRPDETFRAEYAQLPHFYSVNRRSLRIRPTLPDVQLIEETKRFQPNTVVCFDIIAAAVAQEMGFKQLNVWFGDLQYRSHWYNAVYDLKGGEGGVAKLPLTLLFCLLWKRLYRKVLPDTRLAIASSVSSEAPLRKMGAEISAYLPYPWPDGGVDIAAASKFETPTFIMFGTLSALGSKSAFDFLLTKVLPLLRAQRGSHSFEILIAGSRNMPAWAEKHLAACPEVKFLGFVDDLAALVSRCHAVLAPIDVPVGNRSRIVTAMSMRALVIAHANTARGNPELVSGENCYLADSAQDFATHMQKAVEDEHTSWQLSAAARATYLKSFEPGIATRRFIQLLLESASASCA